MKIFYRNKHTSKIKEAKIIKTTMSKEFLKYCELINK